MKRKIYLLGLMIYCAANFSVVFGQKKGSYQEKKANITGLRNFKSSAQFKTTDVCDTVNASSTFLQSVYSVTGGGGFLVGANKYNDQEKAAYFDFSTTTYGYLTKVWLYFGVANSTSSASLTKVIPINVYSGDATNGPTTLLTTVNTTLGAIKADVDNEDLTEIIFPTPVSLPASKKIFIGFGLTNLTWSTTGGVQDSLGLFSTQADVVYSDENGGGWEKYQGAWGDLYSGWGIDLGLAIFPIISDVSTGCSALPVTFASFTGGKRANSNVLNWSTATEANNIGFELQRSADGKEFSKLAFVNSKATNGNSNSNLKYEFVDEKPFATTSYYRLKQLDKDGKSAYSEIVTIKGGKPTKLELTNVYPNPAKEKLNVVIAAPNTGKVTFIITDITGKIVAQQNAQLNSGDNIVPVVVQSLKSGNYLIKVVCDNGCESAVKKFVKD